ncbi:hypothetical protein Daura_25220 [Dactylosporangium aurantiacum]|uniref:Uncharacterized protein n=1 Tax=Dactylosporangium aurantiacum TaxID=35754 RepID=A0A9Q9MH85_9ACTN|nr:hypothetical protein [Dactylosporangium aurantiacum]MDG6108612.1 hypothetical protein [Dactylosporangium aurantiacum]UWZ59168.1 hypothetical protein Daura_25220 [Dactylosporangium aurantiacum]
MTDFEWGTLSAARQARLDAVPDMVRHALRVLEDVLEEADHACTFTLEETPLTGDLDAAVRALLPASCEVAGLTPVPVWSTVVGAALPGFFVPSRQPQAWAAQAAPRVLAEALSAWVTALLARLWPATAQAWELTVRSRDWYEAAYVDVVVLADGRVWLLHLGVSD